MNDLSASPDSVGWDPDDFAVSYDVIRNFLNSAKWFETNFLSPKEVKRQAERILKDLKDATKDQLEAELQEQETTRNRLDHQLTSLRERLVKVVCVSPELLLNAVKGPNSVHFPHLGLDLERSEVEAFVSHYNSYVIHTELIGSVRSLILISTFNGNEKPKFKKKSNIATYEKLFADAVKTLKLTAPDIGDLVRITGISYKKWQAMLSEPIFLAGLLKEIDRRKSYRFSKTEQSRDFWQAIRSHVEQLIDTSTKRTDALRRTVEYNDAQSVAFDPDDVELDDPDIRELFANQTRKAKGGKKNKERPSE